MEHKRERLKVEMAVKTRTEQLKAQHRKIFVRSLALAVVVHIAVFVFSPTFRANLPFGSALEDLGPLLPSEAPIFVEALFGPPTITGTDGGRWTEPPDRVLEARRGIEIPRECVGQDWVRGSVATAEVKLRVRPSGLVNVLGLARSSGNECFDEVLVRLAGALHYHWLPNGRFPAPVELVQPVSLTEVNP